MLPKVRLDLCNHRASFHVPTRILKTRSLRGHSGCTRPRWRAAASRRPPYQDPQLATVKVGGDRDNPLMVREGVTSKQIMEELRQKILETGLLPSGMVDVNAGQDRGRRWPRVTGRTRTRLLPCR